MLTRGSGTNGTGISGKLWGVRRLLDMYHGCLMLRGWEIGHLVLEDANQHLLTSQYLVKAALPVCLIVTLQNSGSVKNILIFCFSTYKTLIN